MNASTKTKETYFDYIGSITVSEELAREIGGQGSADQAVHDAMLLPEIKAELSEIDPSALAQELDQYGAWDEEELKDHDENLKRILWIACGDIYNNLEN